MLKSVRTVLSLKNSWGIDPEGFARDRNFTSQLYSYIYPYLLHFIMFTAAFLSDRFIDLSFESCHE